MRKWLFSITALIVGLVVFQTLAVEKNVKETTNKDSIDALKISPVEAPASITWAPAVEPKPLTLNVTKGLAWLMTHQHNDGGWSQGEESANMGRSQANLKDVSNVADTCAAALAFVRSGSTPQNGPYANNILNAVLFVCNKVSESDDESLFITNVRNTRLQSKLGTYIDTFLTSMLFAEVNGKMPDPQHEQILQDAYTKVMDKIERNQKADGTFGGAGWANTLSFSLASKGINRSAQSGFAVSEQVRERMEIYAAGQYDQKSQSFSASNSAGIDLYASAANLSAMQDSDNTNKEQIDDVKRIISNAKTPQEKEAAQKTLDRFDRNESQLQSAKNAVIKKLDDPTFISGFGSNGGEEFLSYMNIGESLVVKGGQDWTRWDEKITANLNRIQNNDGSWSGHHCITGRTFCTSVSLLVLMTDRAPVPLAAKIKRQ